MTQNKDQKRLIRERMHKTGESYASARENFLRDPRPGEALAGNQDVPRARLPDGVPLDATLGERWLESQARFYGIRVVHESSGRWVARSDDYPELRGEGDDAHAARRAMLDAIAREPREDDFFWRDAVDDETAFVIELQEDD